MDNFDWRTMSTLTFPASINPTEYLRYEANGTWTATNKDQTCVDTNSNPAYAVAVLKAKMHPINDEDRGHMIASLHKWIQQCQAFIDKCGPFRQWKADVKDARKGIDRMRKEIERLQKLELHQ
jgi:hypothetical protein